ncbi:hypothetical protein [Paraglaciecola sp.]|uniref:hypothetical protein n=1 Tax=Paraglaciecola sp. TaxID=1920173 RepID=UPI003EF17AA6
MFFQSSLLVLLLMPVITYLAGAVAYSAYLSVRNKPSLVRYHKSIIFRNSL